MKNAIKRAKLVKLNRHWNINNQRNSDFFQQILLAFAFNAKSFATVIPVFPFFPSRPFFSTNCRKLFRQRFKISYQESVRPRSHLFLGHTKKYFRKNCSRSCDSRRVWHMTRLMHDNQHSQHPQKHKKQPETWKQVSQQMPEDSRVKVNVSHLNSKNQNN